MSRTTVFAGLALFALFAVVAAVGVAQKKEEAFLTKQLIPSSGKAKTASKPHDDVEETTVRFKVAQMCPAPEMGSEAILTVLTCDNDDGYGYDHAQIGFAMQQTIVGYCWTNSDDYEYNTNAHIPLPGNPNVGISGMYTMACQLNEAARECGVDVGPGGLQISSNGIVYEVTTWATFDPFTQFPTLSSGCPAGSGRQAMRRSGRKANNAAARGLKSEGGAAKAAYYHEPEPLPATVYSGTSYIFSGALTVSSVDSDCPYDAQGFLEYLGPEDVNEGTETWNTTTPAQLPSYAVGPLKHPFTVTMRFRSTKRDSY